MMAISVEGKHKNCYPSIEGTLKGLSAPLSSPPSDDGDVVSPLSPLSSHNLCSADCGINAARPSKEDVLSSIADVVSPLEPESPWMECCWSDATTASAVLSLLHKDPMGSPSDIASERENTRNSPYITCSVCFETLDPGLYPQTSIAADCDHSSIPDTHICTICLSRSLDIQFSDSQAAVLTCPICHGRLSDEEVERWASRPTFAAYDVDRTWRILEDDTDFVRCINPDCGYGQLHAGGLGDPIVICANCGVRTCYIHRDVPWHEGSSCAEFEIMEQSNRIPQNLTPLLPTVLRIGGTRREQPVSEEILSQRTIQETTRACPSCFVATEKAGGCKYMRCGVCWQEWCWDCGIFWERGHLSVDCALL
ncbi:hypothetical protein BJY01DRAFT_216783 [Aspergillus pseudoustus]|uniref:RBR-type E3 ubiquitin transferase n=1 Tax=Aspergillus pseudoustus TaxID=1810923 RepID=A0ABR4JQC8_9EURO